MTALDYIIYIPKISSETLAKKCLDVMIENECFYLPVEKNGKLAGKISLDFCVNAGAKSIGTGVEAGFASVYFNTHVFDVLRILDESKLDSCAVLGENFELMGIVTKTAILEGLSKSLTIEQDGAIILLEMAVQQYSSSEICRIIESENSQLLGLWLENVPESGRIRASLKINSKNAERIINGLMRFNYEVVATFGDEDYKENVEKRFQALMKYLDI